MKNRLYSLDVLRGLDMILLVIVGPVVKAADRLWHFSPAVMGQFKHGWECFTLWDLIMPLFVFMCGAAIPFALGRRMKDGKGGREFWKHVLLRVAMLWVLGMIVQGNLLTLDPAKINPYSNTLQAIAIGYLAAAAVMLVRIRALRIAAPVVLALIYTLMLILGGDYSEHGNFAFKTDIAILTAILPTESKYLADPNHYTWFSTSLMFAAMTLAGMHATEILRGLGGMWRKATCLFAYGAALLIVGWIASVWIPVIKPIYTLSFTAQAMGYCVLLLALLYVLTDILMLRKGLGIVVLFGQFALMAYLVGGSLLRPVLAKFADILLQGFPHAFGFDPTAMGFVAACAISCELILLLYVRRLLLRGNRTA